MGRTVRTISHAMLPIATSNKPEKLVKRVTFIASDPVLARDFRPDQTWTADTVVRRRRSVLYEIQVNSEMWVRHRNQMKHRQIENLSTTSISLSLLFDTFKLPTQARPQTSESTQEQSIQRPKRTRKQPSRLQVNPNSQSHEESAV